MPSIPKFFKALSLGWTALFWFMAVALPLATLMSEVHLPRTWNQLFDPVILAVVRATLWQGFWSTAISSTLGLALGLWVGKQTAGRSHFYSLSQVLLSIPFSVPTVVAAMAWVGLLGRSGSLNAGLAQILRPLGMQIDWAYSLNAVILAHVFLNIPLVALGVSQARVQVSEDQIEAARGLGSGPFQVFRWVIWPQIQWAFASVSAQVLCLCALSFSLILILGGGPPVQTLETELYQRLRYGTVDLTGAVVCAFWELLMTLSPWLCVIYFQKKKSSWNSFKMSKKPRILPSGDLRSRLLQVCSQVLILGICASFILPYFSVLNRTVFHLWTDHTLRAQILKPFWNTLQLAIASGLGAVLTALAALLALEIFKFKKFQKKTWLREILLALLLLPSGISMLVLSLGVWLTYEAWFDPFDGSFWFVAGLQMTSFFPLVFRILWPVSQNVQTGQLEAASSLGAPPFQAFWQIEFPRWKTPLITALAMAMGASLGELGAVSLFYSEKLISIPLLLSRWMNQYRFEQAQALAGLLFLFSMGTTGVAVLVTDRKENPC